MKTCIGWIGFFTILALSAGCDGLIDNTRLGPDELRDSGTEPSLDGSGPGIDGGSIDRGPPVGISRLALISREEYMFSVRDVFFGLTPATGDLPEDYFGAIRFVDNHQQPLQTTTVEQYETVAWSTAEVIVTGTFPAAHATYPSQSRLDVLLQPVSECSTRNANCAVAMAARYGARLYRRPLATAELDELRELFEWTVRPGTAPEFTDGGSGTFVDGIRVLLATLLESPNFVFHPERGSTSAEPDLVSLDSHARAVRLASFIWRSVPDQMLTDAARDGMLETPSQVAEQARRMLADPRADRMWSSLSRAWLVKDPVQIDDSQDLSGDGDQWTPQVAQAAAQDVRQFIIHLARNEGTLEELFTSSGGMGQGATLEWLIGVNAAVGEWTDSIPNRHGLLTLPGVMASNNHSGFTSALIRGLFLRQSILCQSIQGPPAALADLISEVSRTIPDLDNPTRREHLVAVTQNGEPCASCHQYTNDVGFAFAAFDDYGRFQTQELTVSGSIPVDSSGALWPVPNAASTTADGPFENHIELIDRLATSPTVARCMARQISRLGLGRDVAPGDEDSLDEVVSTFDASGRLLTELVVAIVTSESFLSRRIPSPTGL
jgi:hypothetical protein